MTGTMFLAFTVGLAAPAWAQDSPPPAAGEHPLIEDSAFASEAIPFDSLVEGVDYVVYDRRGEPTTLRAIVANAAAQEVLLVGEEHDDMVGHAIEVEVLDLVADEMALTSPRRTVVLSLEMFERDVQYILDEYLAGFIGEDHFLRSTRPWDDYEARYRPIVEAARSRGMPVVAANAPRRYVSRVTREGPESLALLPGEALRYLPPLPYPGPSPRYREQWDAIMEEAMAGYEGDAQARDYTANPNTIWSQALWDASMGHAVSQALVRHVGGFVVHFAGSFHVESGTGILERIHDYRPGTRVATVVMTKVEDVGAWVDEEHGSLGDFVILTRRPDA
ncbi:MAG: ChaN family lipoprotein [Gemmatimonadetes bacterium]|nr:ChaN family lipoprotein [Gemmatimonadota bacterium]NNL29398.1 ChaN family lipoprotein [Gemmatimonadota bacterium]